MYQVTYSDPQLSVFEARTSLVLDMAGQGAGKTLNIGVDTYYKIIEFPQVKGFIGANTHKQLSQTTISRCLETWKLLADWDEYSKSNPTGAYVINKKPPAHFIVYHRLPNYQGTICFENGAVIFVGSLENYMAHDGKEFGWAHLDETKDTKKEAVTQVISARLRQYGFWYRPNEIGRPCFFDATITPEQSKEQGIVAFNPLYIHTSPSMGGVDWINELFGIDKHEREIRLALADRYGYYHYVDEDVTVVIYQTYWNEKNLPPNYIQKRRRELTDNEQLLYIEGYPFSKTGAEYFPEFVRRKTVVPRIPFKFNDTFHISFDFNVVPYITLLIGQVDYVVKYYNEQTGKKKEYLEDGDVGFEMLEVMRIKIGKEMCLKPPDNETEKACEEFCDWLKINNANCDVLTYGDASGKARIPGLGSLTNFKIINRIISQHYYSEEKVGKENVSVLKRKNFLNRLFAGKYPEIEIYISEECEELIRDLEFLKQAPDGGKFKEKAKDPSTGKEYEKIGHTSDALEYFICKLLFHYLKDI